MKKNLLLALSLFAFLQVPALAFDPQALGKSMMRELKLKSLAPPCQAVVVFSSVAMMMREQGKPKAKVESLLHLIAAKNQAAKRLSDIIIKDAYALPVASGDAQQVKIIKTFVKANVEACQRAVAK